MSLFKYTVKAFPANKNMKLNSVPFILASSSPRRKELLEEAGYTFTVQIPDIDEAIFDKVNLSPSEFAEKLAMAKAKNVVKNFPDALIIAADTIVDLNGQIIGKPKDAQDARDILEKLSACVHKVITALALVQFSSNVEMVQSETTTIYPKK
ncbi:MAG: Maf family protein, partial [Planctomycetota bacterium]